VPSSYTLTFAMNIGHFSLEQGIAAVDFLSARPNRNAACTGNPKAEVQSLMHAWCGWEPDGWHTEKCWHLRNEQRCGHSRCTPQPGSTKGSEDGGYPAHSRRNRPFLLRPAESGPLAAALFAGAARLGLIRRKKQRTPQPRFSALSFEKMT